MKSKSTILVIILLAALFAGCVQQNPKQATAVPTVQPTASATFPIPSETATITPTATPLVEVTPTGKSILIKLDSQRGFSPATRTIQPGDEIYWDNYDNTVTLTLISGDGLFVAQPLAYYVGYRYVFKTQGTYSFYLKENKNLTGTIIVSQPVPTASTTPTTSGQLPSGSIYVDARMIKPAYWGPGKYSLERAKAQIINEQINPLSITAQIVSDGQVLEEKSFVLEQQGSGYQFSNDMSHFINSTNVTLRLLVPGYQPTDYNFTTASVLG